MRLARGLASTNDRRGQELKAVEERRAVDEIRAKILDAMAQLRQHEGELTACETRLKFHEEKSACGGNSG